MNFIRYYNNKTIIAPSKCGTKFLNDVFNCSKQENVMSLEQINHTNFKWLIVRDPYEHLVSGLSTIYNTYDNQWGMDEILKRIIHVKNVHWVYGFYRSMLYHKINNVYVIVELKNLSKFIDHLQIERPEINPHIHKSAEDKMNRLDLISYINKNYPNEWSILMNMVDDEKKYYQLLLDKTEIFVPSQNTKRFINFI